MEEKTLIITIPWTDDIDQKLSVSAGTDLAIIKSQVKNGAAQLWYCTSAKKAGYVVTRIDRTGEGLELCLVLGEGSGFEIFAPKFLDFARRKNIGFRTHVRRKGLIKMWSKLGVEISDYVLRIK